MRYARNLLAALALAGAAPALAAEFNVVVNLESPVDTLTREQVSDLFLKRTTSFPGGFAAKPVDRPDGSKLFEAFCRSIHGKAGSVVHAFWTRVSASGRDSAPPVRQTDEEVLAYVRSTKGAIGYVSAGISTTGVRVVQVD